MMSKASCFMVVVCFLTAVSGCATIVSGRTQSLPVVSNPSGAIVTVGAQKQISPATFILDKRQNYVVRVEKEGYQPVEITLKKGVSGWVWGNICFGLLGGPIGVIIDISSGSATKFTPGEVEVNLVKQELGLNDKDFKNKTVLLVKLIEN